MSGKERTENREPKRGAKEKTAQNARKSANASAAGASLFLEGGGMRGFYTLGVLSRMLDEGILMDYVVGVSSGTLAAIRYLAGACDIGFIRDLSDARYALRFSALMHPDKGLIRTNELIDHSIPREIIEKALERHARFLFPATRASDAELQWWSAEDCASVDEVRTGIIASCSIPVVMPKCSIGGEVFVDGGIRDSIPLDRAMKEGYTHHVAVLTRPRGYRKSRQYLELYLRHWLHPYPALRRAILERHLNYNASMERVEKEENAGRAFVFRPDKIELGRFQIDKRKFEQAYQMGRESCEKRLNDLIAFLDRAQSLS